MHRRDLLKVVALSAVAGPVPGRNSSLASDATPAAPSTPITAADGILLVRWELEIITRADGSTLTPDDPSKHSIQFLDGGRVAVQADCNSGSGTYTLDGTSLTISQLITTLIGCEPGSIGSDFGAALADVNSYSISTEASDILALTTTDGRMLTFNPGLADVVWHFTRFQGGDGSELIVDDPSRYTLELPGDSSVRVRADCNRGTGTAIVDGDGIDLIVALTRMACPPGSHANDYAKYLDEAVSWVIRDGQLHLSLPVDAGIASFTPVVVPASPTATPATG
jgi:heat shock protein HslJ